MYPSKKVLVLSLFAFLTLSFSRALYAAPVATIENPQGEVFIHSADDTTDTWKPVSQSTPVNSGDTVKTKNGSCALTYGEQASFQVDANTSFVVRDQDASQDIELTLGNLKGKVNKGKVAKPFQVVTPAAVAAVRGTDVDFGYNENGELTVDLHNQGPVQVINSDAEMELELANDKKIKLKYDTDQGTLNLCYGVNAMFAHPKDKDGKPLPVPDTNANCGYTGSITFKFKGKEHTLNACDCEELDLAEETAAGEGPVNTTVNLNETFEPTPTPTVEPTPTEEPTPTPPPISQTEETQEIVD